MSIDKIVDKLRKDVKSDSLSMSIGEIQGLYERDELDIHPKFQRILRWEPYQKTKLIESILLRIPIPPIFVAQDVDGGWDVVDGMQRLGTILHFLGVLKGKDGRKQDPLQLVKTNLLPSLDGLFFSPDYGDQSFPKPLRLDFLRSRLDINIILRESDESAKYELFERLNTGGSIASAQEVRNCVLVWINEGLYDWLLKLAEFSGFQNTVSLSSRQEEVAYRTELVLRFLAFYKIDVEKIKSMGDISEFLNDVNREIATDANFDTQHEAEVFRDTFGLIDKVSGVDAFRKYHEDDEKYGGRFLISAYEAVSMGVAYNINAWRGRGNAGEELDDRIKRMWVEPAFINHIGTGAATKPRMQHTIPFGREYFS